MATGTTLDLARRDAAFIISQGGFQTDITFILGTSGDVVVQGTATKHHLGYDVEGQRTSTKEAQVTVNEQDLVDGGINTRNASGEISLRGAIVTYADSTLVEKTYTVTERYPNETLGHIVIFLGDYE